MKPSRPQTLAPRTVAALAALNLAILSTAVLLAVSPLRPAAAVVEVYADPGCLCCALWARHLGDAAYRVRQRAPDPSLSAAVPGQLRACHTARVAGYLIEGHVPAAVLGRLLGDRPALEGLAVPGMPAGAPGMPADEPEGYAVWAFTGSGLLRPYAHVPAEVHTPAGT